jgi:hypothetical protein
VYPTSVLRPASPPPPHHTPTTFYTPASAGTVSRLDFMLYSKSFFTYMWHRAYLYSQWCLFFSWGGGGGQPPPGSHADPNSSIHWANRSRSDLPTLGFTLRRASKKSAWEMGDDALSFTCCMRFCIWGHTRVDGNGERKRACSCQGWGVGGGCGGGGGVCVWEGGQEFNGWPRGGGPRTERDRVRACWRVVT